MAKTEQRSFLYDNTIIAIPHMSQHMMFPRLCALLQVYVMIKKTLGPAKQKHFPSLRSPPNRRRGEQAECAAHMAEPELSTRNT